jgi:hypothetical protein
MQRYLRLVCVVSAAVLLLEVFATRAGQFIPLAVAAPAGKPAEEIAGLLFREQFEDAQLAKRGWYDGDRFKISDQQPFAGQLVRHAAFV